VLLMHVLARKGNKELSWRLIDRRTDGMSAMSRTTGYTAAAITMLLARRQFTEPGVHPPEDLGRNPALAREIVNDLKEHGVNVCENVPVPDPA
ncbi:MAG TPA: saccharopine dehydrogenase C-terminal domain-containing protein, partial [Chroococcales cyanobacterium]